MVTILECGYVVNTTITEGCADHINNIWMRSYEVIWINLLKLKIDMICLETVEFCAVLYLVSIFCMSCLRVSGGHIYCSKDWGQLEKQRSVFWKKLILLFSNNALNWSKHWSTFIMLQKIYISNKSCSVQLLIHQKIMYKMYHASWENTEHSTFTIRNGVWSTNQHITMISEGSCDSEDWSNDAENLTGINNIFKYFQI